MQRETYTEQKNTLPFINTVIKREEKPTQSNKKIQPNKNPEARNQATSLTQNHIMSFNHLLCQFILSTR